MVQDTPRQARRRNKLRALLGTDPGAQTELAVLIGTPNTHISAILAGRRGIGDQLAEKIEKHYGKPAGWMDQEGESWPFSEELAEVVMSLPPQELINVEQFIWLYLRRPMPERLRQQALESARTALDALSLRTEVTPTQQRKRMG